MMLIKNLQLDLPVHISFVLYRYDYIDNIIITRALKHCKNLSESKDMITVDVDDFKNCLLHSTRLSKEIQRVSEIGLPEMGSNSIHFIWNILLKLKNLNLISFTISNNKEYTRLVSYHEKLYLNFNYTIIEGVLDLTKMFNGEELDAINKFLIKNGYLSNNYLDRQPFFYIGFNEFLDVIADSSGLNDSTFSEIILSLTDVKLEESDPVILVKTDYMIY